MKKFIHFLVIIISISGVSCSENMNDNETKAEKTCVPNEIEIGGIQCIDGVLHFDSAQTCLSTMQFLASNENLSTFEAQYKFQSMRSFVDSLFEDLENCTTPAEYDAVLAYCDDYIVMDESNGCLMPRVSSVGYASIANTDGVFYVSGIKHVVDGDQIYIENLDASTRTETPMTCSSYIVPSSVDSATRAEEVRYHDIRYETTDYKVFARTNVLRNAVSEIINGQQVIVTEFGVQIHVFGHKHKALFGWDKYQDRYYAEEIHIDLTIGGINWVYGTYNGNSDASEYGRNLYVTLPFNDGQGYFVGATVPDMPASFNCIVFRARSRSIGNCGALIDKNRCRPSVILPVTACKEA